MGKVLKKLFGIFRDKSKEKRFVVICKSCHRKVPIGSAEFPFQAITVECRLCANRQRYRPSEVMLGLPDPLVIEQEHPARRHSHSLREPVLIDLFR